MTVIVTKNSSTTSAVPTTSDLVQGELAVNVTDKRIFTENASTQIVELGTNPSTVTTTTATVSGTLTANGTFASSNAVVTGGSINSTPIGAVTPSTVRGSTVTATTGFVGGLTGNVVGNVTGNVTGNVVGNVTGDLTGNVTASSGTSTVNNLVVNGTVDFSNTRLTDVAEPIAGSDAATKTYVDTSIAAVIDGAPAALDTLNELAAALNDDASFHTTVTNALTGKLALSGGTMTGQLSLGANKIVSVADPTLAQDVATKAYVDAADTTGLPLAGGTMSGAIAMGTNKITGLGTPTDAADATTKAYTDSILGSATSAADSAAAAATSASNASTSASNAASSATAASGSETAAALSATNAAASYDSFDDRYLGAKASDPTVDNDGDALIAGATYFNTTVDSMKVYSGSAWSDVAPVATSVTLSQVTDFPTQSGQSGKYLTTNGTVPSWATLTTDPTLGSLTKTFTNGEVASISLTSNVLVPNVSVTKEVPQSGATNNTWDVNSTSQNYTRLNSAPATTLSWNGDLATASYTQAFSVSSQDIYPSAVAFNADGTKMFIAGNQGDDIGEYTLSTGFDVSTASFVDSFSVNSQESAPMGVAFNTDGTRMFVNGEAANTVFQYALSTGFDVSTASYTQGFSTAAQDSASNGVTFNTDGTKMFVTGESTKKINEYTLSSAFDVSTASFVDGFLVSGQTTQPKDTKFNSDGTEMYIVSRSPGNVVLKYTLTTGFDVSTASYANVSFSIANEETSPQGLAFSADTSKMYVCGFTGQDVNEYSLPLALSLGSGSFASADVGKTIEANSGVFVLTTASGSYVQTTAPTSFNQVASGSWEMFGVVYNTVDGDLELSNYVNTYDIVSASYASISFNFNSSQGQAPGSIRFNNDGSKMFIVANIGQDINEYTLSTNFNVSTASFVDAFSVASQEDQPEGLAFNTDGTKMYVCGNTGDDINEYTLSTGFDISTSSYTRNFSVSSQETSPKGLSFNNDGTKMFVIGVSSDAINEYTLSTAFNVSTASFVDAFSISSQASNPMDVVFSGDGTKMFVAAYSSQDILLYTLSTGFDVSTASYTSALDVSSVVDRPQGLTFNNDGTKMFITDNTTQTVYEYASVSAYITSGYHAAHTTNSTDTTYWTDINSMTANQAAGDGEVYYCISTDDRTTWTVIKDVGGERDIVRNNGGTWQYNSNGTYASETWANGTTNTELATIAQAMTGAVSGFDVSTSVYSQNFSVSAQEGYPTGIAFNTDGTKMFIIGLNGVDVNEYTLSTGFNVSTASYSQNFSVASQDTTPTGLAFNANGTKMFVVGVASDSVHEYTLSAGFNVSTASFVRSFSVAAQDTTPIGIAFNTDGTKMFVVGLSGQDVNEYTLSTGFNVSTASFVDSFSVSAQDTAPRGIAFSTDGTKMFVVGATNDAVYEYTLSTGFDVSTASFVDSFSVSAQDTAPYGIAFNTDGTKMFVVGENDDDVNEYVLGSYPNQMDKTQLDAVTDPNHIALSNDFDLSIILNMTSGTTVPSSNGVAINYDANILNKGAVLGTDYDFDAPAQNKVRITALAGNNLKVRVV